MTPDATPFVHIRMDSEKGAPVEPLRVALIYGRRTPNPDGDSFFSDRDVIQGHTPTRESCMVWADETIAVSNTQLPNQVGETTVVQQAFGDTTVQVGLQKTDQGLRVTSTQKITSQTQ